MNAACRVCRCRTRPPRSDRRPTDGLPPQGAKPDTSQAGVLGQGLPLRSLLSPSGLPGSGCNQVSRRGTRAQATPATGPAHHATSARKQGAGGSVSRPPHRSEERQNRPGAVFRVQREGLPVENGFRPQRFLKCAASAQAEGGSESRHPATPAPARHRLKSRPVLALSAAVEVAIGSPRLQGAYSTLTG